jgi:hypothetical protein
MMMKAPSLEAHIKTFCQERLVKCRMGCGASLAAKSLVTHQQNGCQNRDVVCELCKATYVAKDGDQHKRRFCPMREVQCRLGCLLRFPAQHTEAHEMTSCSMRLVNCSKGCGQTCAAKDQATHECDCKGTPVMSDLCLLRSNRPLSSMRPRPLDNILDGEKSTSPGSVGSPRLPGLNESPNLKHWARPHSGSPDQFENSKSPERIRTKCNACGHHERHCNGCGGLFCSRCLVRSGLPKSNPPLCATCSRENNMRTRELLAKGGPSPMRFGGGPKPH